MPEVHASRHFNAAPTAVFDAASDHVAFLSGKGLRCTLTREGQASRNGVGAVREVRGEGLVFVEDVIAFDRPRRFDYVIRSLTRRGRALPLRHERGWMQFTPDAGGTRVDWHSRFEFELPVVGGLIGRLLAWRLRHPFERMLARCAQRLDAAGAR